MRVNTGEYVRISHIWQTEKTPNFLSLTDKGEKMDGELQNDRTV